MSDEKINIHFDTTSDTTGAEKAGGAIKNVKKEAESLNKTSKSGNKFSSSLNGIQDKALKLGSKLVRGGVLFSAVTLIGQQFSQRSKQLLDFADTMDAAGVRGSKYARVLGNVGSKMGQLLNPIGAYMKSVNDLAAAKKQLIATERAHRKEVYQQTLAVEKAAKSLRAHQAYKEIAQENEKATKAWADELDNLAKKAEYQEKKFQLLKEAAQDAITAKEEALKDQVDADVAAGKITAERGDEVKFGIGRSADQARERNERKEYQLEQDALDEKEDLARRRNRRAVNEFNRLENTAKGEVLSEKELDKYNQIKARPKGSTDSEKAEAAAKISADKAARERLSEAGFAIENGGDYEALKKKLQGDAEKASGDLKEISNRRNLGGISENNRRRRAGADFANNDRDERTRRKNVVNAATEKSAKKAAEKLKDQGSEIGEAAAGIKVGNKAGQKIVESIAKSFEDGAISAAESPILTKAVATLKNSKSAGDDAALTLLKSMIQNYNRLEREMKVLQSQVRNSR